jgi:hypothetical protein
MPAGACGFCSFILLILRKNPSFMHSSSERITMRRIYTVLVLAIILLGAACGKSGGTAAGMSGDDKHKLFQAAMNTRDPKLMQQVLQAIGLSNANGSPTTSYDPFIKEHADWSAKNFDFVREYIAPDKAKEYVNSHLPN